MGEDQDDHPNLSWANFSVVLKYCCLSRRLKNKFFTCQRQVSLIKYIPTLDSLRIKVPEGEAAAEQRTMDKVSTDCFPGWRQE